MKSKNIIVTAVALGIMGTSVCAASAIKDITVKYNEGIRYTLNGEEILEGQGGIIYEDRVYVPLRAVSENLGVDVDYKDGVVILEQDKAPVKTAQKTTDIKFNNKEYTLSLDIIDEIAPYTSLTVDEDNNLCLIRFEKEDKIANIGSFTIFTEKDYDAMDPKEMPVPTEVLRQDGIVIGFTGLQDMPFELETEEAKLVGNYHENVSDMLKTVTLTEK